MKLVRRILFWTVAGLAAVGTLGVLSFADLSTGPRSGGQSLRSWIIQYRENRQVTPRGPPGSPHSVREPLPDEPAMWRRFRRDETPSQRDKAEEAVRAIRRMGTNCTPALLRWINYEQPLWKQKLYDAVSRFDDPDGDYTFSDKMPADGREVRAVNATIAFQILGEAAGAAIPRLGRLVVATNAAETAERVMECLPYMGRDGLWELIKVFTNDQLATSLRMTAGCQIGWMRYLGTNARPAVPVLIGYLASTNASLAQTAAWALAGLKTDPEICVPAISNCLHSADTNVRTTAARALMQFGTDALAASREIGAVIDEGRDLMGPSRMKAWLRRIGAN